MAPDGDATNTIDPLQSSLYKRQECAPTHMQTHVKYYRLAIDCAPTRYNPQIDCAITLNRDRFHDYQSCTDRKSKINHMSTDALCNSHPTIPCVSCMSTLHTRTWSMFSVGTDVPMTCPLTVAMHSFSAQPVHRFDSASPRESWGRV